MIGDQTDTRMRDELIRRGLLKPREEVPDVVQEEGQRQAPAEVLTVQLRPAEADEPRWVQATWSFFTQLPSRSDAPDRSARMVDIGPSRLHSTLDANAWRRAHSRLVDTILEEPGTEITIAVWPGMPLSPVGWSVHTGAVLHYVFVVPVARRLSVGRQLVQASRCSSSSHMTRKGSALVKHLRRGQTS